MAINNGNIKTSVNYNLEAQKPLDARSVRPTKADLYKKESWSYDGDSVYIYNGMLVYVEDEKKTYCLVDETKYNEASGWELVGTGASSGGGSDITVDSAMSESSTNPVQNRVVKKYVDDAISSIPPQEPTVDVIDNLDSTDTGAALSANQGRILNEKIAAVASEATKIFNVKGSCKYAELPTTNNAVGDVYNITDSFTIGSESYTAGTNVVWDGQTWDALGGSIDLSAYATTETVVAMVQDETDRARGAEAKILSDIITIKANVANKVTKEDGKGLSEENFTSALKKKLNELENYDDSTLQTKVASLQSQLDTLTNDDSIDEVIAKYEELKAFLEGLGNDEYGAFIEEISNQIAELNKGLTDANKRIDSVEERLEDLASEIVIDEKEVYIGADEPADAKIWIDTDEDYPEGGGGSIEIDSAMSDGSTNAVQNKVVKHYIDEEAERVVAYAEGVANDAEAAAKRYTDEKVASGGSGGGGLETRILYVPEMNTGETLTSEEKAYNLETCQKLLAGTAKAVIDLDGIVRISSESIADFSVIGLEGIYIKFGWSVYLPLDYVIVGADGDILKTQAAKSGNSIVLPYSSTSFESSLYLDIMMAAMDDQLPTIYCESDISDSSPIILCNNISISSGYIFIEAYCRRNMYDDIWVLGMVAEEGVLIKAYELPKYITLETFSEANIAWWNSIKMSGEQVWHIPYITYYDNYYYPISMVENTDNVVFVIYRNSAFEKWKLTSDGTMTQITE